MKSDQQIKAIIAIISSIIIGTCCLYLGSEKKVEDKNTNKLLLSNNILKNTPDIDVEENKSDIENKEVETEEEETTEIDENIESVNESIVFDGLTRQELIDKLNRNLNSTISGKGELFADYSLSLGIDPYLAVAIVLHETGCSWNCSDLVNQCYNVGGQKGGNSCYGSSYASFSSLDDGIISFLDNLYRNYYAYGLTTPEQINSKYAASTTWASKINYYMNKIRAS